MSIKHTDIEIPEDKPFKNCKLGREKYGQILTSIVGAHEDGFVLAINNEWGTGKTTFVKMWRQMLINQNFKTLYFNAWENDFDLNPLAEILAELKKVLPEENSKGFNSLLTKGAVIAQNVLPAIAKGIAKRHIDIEELTAGVEGATKAATEILKDEIKRYSARQKGLIDFKKELEKYVKSEENSKPLIFIIDELDRCRPTYAVEVLEQMKHFFTVPGIIFVLSIDKIQLGNAVRGVYGSEQLDSSEYLRRFIDIEYVIPTPSSLLFCNYLYDYYQFDDFFSTDERKRYREFKDDKNALVSFSATLFDNSKLTLRQQDKLFAHAKIALKAFSSNSFVFPSVYIFLIYLYSYHKSLYLSIVNRELSMQKFITGIESHIPTNISGLNERFLLHTEALLLYSYHNFYRETDYNSKLISEEKENIPKKLLVTCKYQEDEMINMLEAYRRDSGFYNYSLDYLLHRISLIENIKE